MLTSLRIMGLTSLGHPLANSDGPTYPIHHWQLHTAGSGQHAMPTARPNRKIRNCSDGCERVYGAVRTRMPLTQRHSLPSDSFRAGLNNYSLTQHPGRCEAEFMLAFHNSDSPIIKGGEPKLDYKSSLNFTSGQILEFELNLIKKSLALRVDGELVCFVLDSGA